MKYPIRYVSKNIIFHSLSNQQNHITSKLANHFRVNYEFSLSSIIHHSKYVWLFDAQYESDYSPSQGMANNIWQKRETLT